MRRLCVWLASHPFRRVTAIAREATYTATGCTATLGAPRRVTCKNTTLLCPLVERCGCPCEAKIEETPGQFILYIHAERTAADHKDDSSRYLSVDKQDFVRKAKTAPMNTAAELIKNVQDLPTKKIDPKLQRSSAGHEP